MAATESQIMTNRIADPITKTTVGENHARVRVDVCRLATLAADAAGHLYRLTQLRAHDRILSIQLVNTADAGMTTVDVGIFTPSDSTTDPVAIDDDGLVVDYDMSSAQATPVEILGTGLTNAADFGKALWEYNGGGPANEPTPGTEYEIVANPGGNPAGGGDYTFIIYYTAGD
jgi:hypothetical protein